MKACVMKAGCTSIEEVVYQNISKPILGPGQVLVRMKAASLNFRDLASCRSERRCYTF